MRFGQSCILLFVSILTVRADDRPVVSDPRLTLELIAEHPGIVTPTGIAVDAAGRIFVIENNTHQRPPDYKGPPTDRVRIFEDFDELGRARKITTFAEGFKDSMGLTLGRDGVLYLATRSRILRLQKDEKKVIVRLETKGNYPHNGLCGFAWDTNGDLIFGLGENLGATYELIGSDVGTLTGGGEGGSMYRCRPDGSKASRIATGFWNPFAHCVTASGNVFAVDNDPDARGPCRLLHVVQGGDFGYRFKYGRKGTHPFQCWNGELTGTLPMVAGTSEAPSGVIPGEFTSLPADYHGELLVTSWGDHTIERFHLQPRGASFAAQPKAIVRGGENFRPVAFAIAPDGSVVFTDWVDKSYPVHGKGRIWRLRAKPEFRGRPEAPPSTPIFQPEEKWIDIARNAQSPHERMQAILRLHAPAYLQEIIPILGDTDPFLASAALEVLGRTGNAKMLIEAATAKTPAALRLGLLLALRKTGDAEGRGVIGQFLTDAEPEIRRAAIHWVGEEKLIQYGNTLQAAAAQPPVTRELFEAWLAARELLDGKKPADSNKETFGEPYAASILKDTRQPALFRLMALRVLRPDNPLLTPKLLADMLQQRDETLSREVGRTLVLRPDAGAQALMRTMALDETLSEVVRGFAVTGLGYTAERPETQAVLRQMRSYTNLWSAAARSLPNKLAPEPKRSPEEWRKLLAADGDAQTGERVFFHPKGPGCYKCHRIDSRGGNVGPDLTFIGKALSRDKLIESILEPSKEIAPAFTTWRITTRDGKERVGMIVAETFDSMVTVGDSQGKIEKVLRTEIEERTAVPKSIMPDDIPNQMTQREFLDLIAFLLERK